MKKNLIWLVCVFLILLSSPSFAYELKTSGMYRARMIMADIGLGPNLSVSKDSNADTLVDQRARLSATVKIDEYLSVGYTGEIDFQFGDAGYATSRNQGGGIGADTVNLETKYLYATVTLPETPYSATLGLQGFRDNFSFALALDDMAGLTINADTKPVKFKLGWFKVLEGDDGNSNSPGNADTNDDATLYVLQTAFVPADKLKVNLDGYFFKNEGYTAGPNMSLLGTSEDLYFLGADVKYDLPVANIDAWVFYNFGTATGAATDGGDLDISGLAASAKVKFSVGGVKMGVRGIYFSGDDDATDNDRSAVRIPWAATNPVHEAVPFLDSGLMLMLPDPYGTTYHNGSGYGMTPAYQEYGVMGLTADAAYTLANMPKLSLRGAVGYFQALEDTRVGTTARQGTNLGSEVCVRVGYKLGEKSVLSFNTAYALLGDFYDGTATGGQDPDNKYESYVMLDVKF